MINNDFIFVIDSKGILSELSSTSVILSGQQYSIFFRPTEEIITYIKLSALDVENTENIFLLIFSNDNIGLLSNDSYRRMCEEHIIKNDAYNSFLYASVYLKGKFALGEEAMKTDDGIWEAYQFMLTNSFSPKGKYTSTRYNSVIY